MSVKPLALPLAATAVFAGMDTTIRLLPPLHDVRAGSKDDQALRMNVRTGEVVAGLTLVAAGGVVSYMSGSIAPLLGAAVVAGTVAGLWEWALHGEGVGKEGAQTLFDLFG